MTIPYLISPLIDDGHVDVINEHCHLFASRGAVGCTHPLVHEALNGSLETHTHTWYKLTQLHSIHTGHVQHRGCFICFFVCLLLLNQFPHRYCIILYHCLFCFQVLCCCGDRAGYNLG